MEPHTATELKLLGAAIVLGLVQLAWAAQASTAQRGTKWNVGPRDDTPPLTGMAGRLERAFDNFRETFPFFAALVIADYLAAKLGPLTLWGSILYVAGRTVYVPLYAFGAPYVRSLVWLISTVGIVMLLAALFG